VSTDRLARLQLDDTFETNDVETNLIRDKQAMLASSINVNIELLHPDANEDALTASSEELVRGGFRSAAKDST
jgi:hypothetical protein